MTIDDLQAEIQQLRSLINQQADRIGQLEKPQGRIFPADLTNPGSIHRAMAELIPNAAGNALANLTDGRAVSGLTDPGVFLAIPGLQSGQGMLMGFNNGTNAVYLRISEQLRFGKIQSVGVCNSYSVVKECDSGGTLLNDILVTVNPVQGGCVNTANGLCLSVGDIIAYLPDPNDPTSGVQVGAYKSIAVGYICESPDVTDLSELRFYPGDFTFNANSTCGDGTIKSQGDVYWDGNFIVQYGSPTPIDHIKVFNFDTGVTPPSGVAGTDYSDIPIVVVSSGTTNANVPTIGGSPCADQSGPHEAKLTVRAKVGAAVASVDSVVCNGDGTISVSYSTMRVLVPI